MDLGILRRTYEAANGQTRGDGGNRAGPRESDGSAGGGQTA